MKPSRPNGCASNCPSSWSRFRTGIFGLFPVAALAAPAMSQVAGGGFDKRHAWYGVAGGDLMGHAVAGLGDIDGDGWNDVILGIPGADGPSGPLSPNYGKAQVRSGRTGGLIYQYSGSANFDKVGTGVCDMGDANPYIGMSFSFSCLYWEQPTLGDTIFRGFARPATIQVVP